ncbi:MAG: PAS domain S-box protein [Chloroflexota bacterium]|nr:PAS domain S-box protein [Chloroflexota bacterium]
MPQIIQKDKSGVAKNNTGYMRCLLVGANDIELWIKARNELEYAGFCVNHVTTGWEAEKEAIIDDEVLLITDYNLPDMRIEELMIRFSERRHKVPFVVVISNRDEKVIEHMMKLGALDYVARDETFVDSLLQVVQRVFKDLNPQKKLAHQEVAFQGSEHLYQVLCETTSDMIQSVNSEGEFVYVNPAWLNTLGYTWDEICYLRFTDVIAPWQLAHCEKVFEDILCGASFENVETTFITKDAREIIVEGSVVPRVDNGVFLYTIGIFRDITERKQVERALKESEEKYATLVEMSNDGVLLAQDGVVLFVNQRLKEIIGLEDANLIGKNILSELSGERAYILDIMTECDVRLIMESISAQMDGKIEPHTYFVPLQIVAGQATWVEIFVKPVEFGGRLAVLALLRDVTDRKSFEESLQKRERYFRSLIEHSADGIVVIDSDGFIRYESLSYDQMLGQQHDGVVGRYAFEMVHPEDLPVVTEMFNWLRSGGTVPQNVEVRSLHSDGLWHWIEATISNYLDDPAIQGIVVNIRDITERKQTENELRKAATVLETMVDGVITMNMQGMITDINEGAVGQFGYKESEVIGQRPAEIFIVEEDRHVFTEQIVSVLRGEQSSSVEYTCRRKDGIEILVSTDISVVNDIHDNPVAIVAVNRDITKLKWTEEALVQQERYFRSLIENSSDGIIVVGERGNIRYQSPSYERTMGCNPDNVLASSIFELPIHPLDLPKVADIFSRMSSHNQFEESIEVRIQYGDGAWHWVEAVAVNYMRDTAIEGIVVSFRDITERKRAQEQLQMAEERYRTIFENSAAAIVVTDEDENIVSWNGLAEGLLGRADADIYMKPVSSLYPAEEWKKVKSEILRQDGVRHRLETKILSTDNNTVDVELSLSLLKSTDGRVTGSVGMLVDISERKQAEFALLESESGFKKAQELAHVGSWERNLKDGSFWISDELKRICGVKQNYYSEARCLIEMAVHPEDREMAAHTMKETSVGSSLQTFTYRVVRPTGETRWINATCPEVKRLDHLGRPRIIMGTIQDITERHQSEVEQVALLNALEEQNQIVTASHLELESALADVREAQEQLEGYTHDLSIKNLQLEATREELAALNQTLEQKVQERTAEVERLLKHKDVFIGQLGHDLKSPLTPLVTLLPIMKDREQDQRQRELFDVALINVKFMQDLVIKTLRLATLDSRTVKVSLEETSLLTLLSNTVEARRLVAVDRGIKLECAMQEDINVWADTVAIREVLDNLLSNSLKFTAEGGIITLDAKNDGDIVVVSIEDTGLGLNEEQLSHIFEEFYKADSSRHDLESQGLGLSICERIVKHHGGRIWAESPGLHQGSKFSFTLKIADAESQVGEYGLKDDGDQ